MSFSKLLPLADRVEQFRSAATLIERGAKGVQIEGLASSAKSFAVAALQRHIGRPMLVITYSTEQAERIVEELGEFLDGIADSRLQIADSESPANLKSEICNLKSLVHLFPANEGLPFEDVVPDYHLISRRLAAMDALLNDRASVVVAPIHAILSRAIPAEELAASRVAIKAGETIDAEAFLAALVELGYERTDTVDRHGEFSRRGGIIDIYASTADLPIRIELFGDEVESIRSFDVVSQRSVEKLEAAEILPAREVVLRQDMADRAVERIKKDLEAQVAKLGPDSEQVEKLRDLVETHYTHISNLAYFNAIDWYIPYLYPGEHTILDYLPERPLIVWDEPMQIRSHWERMRDEDGLVLADHRSRGEALDTSVEHFTDFNDTVKAAARRYQGIHLSLLARPIPWAQIQHHLAVESTQADVFGGDMDLLAKQLKTWLEHECIIAIATSQEKRIVQILGERDLPVRSLEGDSEFRIPDSELKQSPIGRDLQLRPAKNCGISNPDVPLRPGLQIRDDREDDQEKTHAQQSHSTLRTPHSTFAPGIYVTRSSLSSGFKLIEAKLIVLTDEEIFGITKLHRPRRVFREGVPISSVLDLKADDYVVHINHGIGYYRGLTTMNTLGVERDFLLVEYAGEDKLYVPTEQIDRVQKYIGGEGIPPVVHRLGGADWARTTKRVRQSVREMAKELIELYAWRQALGGQAFSPDTPWQQEMESAFPYEETPDQRKVIEEVKKDLEEPKSMDRLICGDVGFGKTEVAIRAAFKVVQDGKQVAVLCPTTVLAQQHWNTFRERLTAFPIVVEMLSRFRSPKEQKAVVEGLKIGTVDIVIGTHRLLSKDVRFKDLGLVIVDEEQRFGVGHKEKLKQLRKTVDVLAMSATPIPRTLHMALSGIRDMSVINDPPEGRVPIRTYIHEEGDSVVREAIVREIDRDGQIYVVHNRIENISHIAERVRRLVPYARIEIAHGQMHEDDLERVMLDFYERRFDVLVCTTIIENGLDIPNVNTIIVFDSDKMGLAQLYQLRGRVGRSDRQAYAYLLFKHDKLLSEIAEKRMDAIREFTELGSGFRIALRDLEIRGAGNLLGAEQHGQVNAVGFDLYCRLLAEAIQELKGEEPVESLLPPVDLPIDAHIPKSYVPNEAQRIYFYKRMHAVKNLQDVQDIQNELDDRFGDPPRPVWNALALLRLRIRCLDFNILAITNDRGRVQIRFEPGTTLSENIIRELAREHRRHQWLPERVFLNLQHESRILSTVEDMVEVVGKALRRSQKAVRVT